MSDTKPIADLKPQRRNANKHSQRGMGQLEKSVQSDGWIGAITVAADGETFDGSARIEVAAVAGFNDAIVVRSDGSRPIVHIREDIPTADDPRAVRLGIAANRIAEVNLAWDAEVLASIGADIDLSTFWDRDEIAALLAQETPESGGGDTVPDVQDGPTRVQPGELWQLGRHRLLCGDSTDADTVARLMGGERAQMMWADPPYGMSFQSNHRTATPQFKHIEGDGEPLVEFLPLCVDIPVWYVCCRWDSASEFMAAVEVNEHKVINWIVWHKSRGGMGDLDAAYRPTHETILYCSKGRALFARSGRDDDTWDIGADAPSSYEHPTQKPIALPQRAIENHSVAGSVVYDPFFGSGPSLIACERTGRRCYGIEIEPRYCDVILKRWEAETGLQAERL